MELVRVIIDDRVLPFTADQATEAARIYNASGRRRSTRVDAMIASAAIVSRWQATAVDAFTLDESGNPFGNQELIEIREAIEELGGTLTAEQQRKCRHARTAGHTLQTRPQRSLLVRQRQEAQAMPSR